MTEESSGLVCSLGNFGTKMSADYRYRIQDLIESRSRDAYKEAHKSIMERTYMEELKDVLSRMQADDKSVRNAIKVPSQNRLMITIDHGKPRFTAVGYSSGARKRRYVKPESDYIYKLANKAYGSELHRRLNFNADILARAIGQLLSTDYKDILHSLPAHFDLLDMQRVIDPSKAGIIGFPNPSDSVFPSEARLSLGHMDPWEWAAEPYCENTEHREYKIHPTSHGVNCRSKSESLLFEIYDSLEIPFHYDEVVTIGGTRISPDFIGARRDGKLIFHEHKGLLTEEYRLRNDWKSGLYASAEIHPGINLIYTYDSTSGTINTKLARETLKDIYWL